MTEWVVKSQQLFTQILHIWPILDKSTQPTLPLLIFAGLYSKVANITDNLCTKKEKSSKNPRFIIKSCFKPRAGYNGACMVIELISTTLESWIDVAPWINIASGKFDKKNKDSPLKCANLCSKI